MTDDRLSLLQVHAHPDDEASKGAGTQAKYAAEGVHNVLVEWSPMNQRPSGILATLFGCCLLLLGLRAVAAVVLS